MRLFGNTARIVVNATALLWRFALTP